MVGKVLYIKYKEIVDGQIVEKVRYAVDRWQADDKYMGESFITFTVKSSKPIAFSVGDYCEYRGETYTLNYIPSVSQRANIGGSGEAFVYEQVKMDSPREELDRAIMLDVTPTTGDYIAALGTNYTGSAQFQLYCGETTANGRTLTPVCALAAKMQANLDRAFPDKGWKVLVDTTSTHEEAGQQVLNTHSDEKTLTFDNTTIANALAEVKNTFEIDFAVKGRTIYIGYTFGAITGNNDGDYYYFGYGKGYLSEDNQGKALFELKRTSDSGQKIVTRLRALGSSKNMPYRYYNKKYNLSQSLFPMNLQLPDTFETPEVKAKHNKERKAVYPWIRDVLGDTNDAYIDKNDNCLDTVEGLREDCMRWDGTNADLKEIYPSIEEVTYGELRAALCEDQDGNKGSSAFPHYGNNERVDEILDIDTDTNVGDGILTESDSTRQTASDTDVRLTSSETSSSLAYNGSAYASKEVEVMSIASQYAGNYIISNSHLWFRASYSLGRHQSENITKTCKVAYRIKVYAKDLSTNEESVICTYISDYKQISNRVAKEYEVEIAKLPDVDAEVQKVDKITVTNPSDIRITFALLVMDIDYSYDQWNVNWNLGLSLYQNPDTDTEWTPSLIWDLEGSASTFMKNPFHVYVKDMGFDFVAAFGTSDTPRIAMKSGMCVAREFEIGNNPQKVEYTKGGITYKAWRLTLAKAEDSSLKTYYPSENFPLVAGDNFVIIGIEMPDVYIQAASMKLLVEATKALADVCDTKHEYEPSVDGIYIQRNYDRCEEEGDVTKSVYWKLGAGMKFPFFGIAEEGKETPDMFSMIIDTLSIREGEGLTPNISIKLSEDFQQSTLQKLTRTVTSITNGSIFKATNIGNGGGLDESSVRAIVSEFTKRRFLSKVNPDTAAGIITFLQGTNWGNFTSESGAAMSVDPTTGQTYMEVDRLKVRLKAFFEQLEVQKVGYVGGKLIVTKGQGVDILDVENIYDTEGNVSAYRCYFLGEQEGRKIDNLLRVKDQMICKDFNVSEGTTDGATNKYYWRLVTAVSSDVVKRGNNVCHWVDLSATDCDTNSDIPEIGDTICHLGNREDTDRQGAEILSVVDANSPSFTIYSGINSYSLVNKEYIDMGVSGGKAFCNIYGSTYIGDRNRENGYISWDYDKEENVWKMRVKGTIDITSPLSSGGTIGGAIDNAANAYKGEFNNFVNNTYAEDKKDFYNQLDGKVETWYQKDDPKDKWAAADYSKHKGDIWYNDTTNKSYRWTGTAWVELKDQAAIDAKALAESKRRVFTTTTLPTPPYDAKDLWVQGENGDIMVCVTPKAAGTTASASDWEKASKYTDDTAAQKAQTTANEAATAAQEINASITAIDGNVDVVLKDKIITKTEAAAIKEALKGLDAIMADVNKTKEKLVNNDVYKSIADDVKTDCDTAYTNLKAAYDELSKYINDTLLVANPITDEILSSYTYKYSNFKTKYEDYVSKLTVVRNSMDALLNTRIGDIATMLGGLKATTDAMNESTQINGGLILSSLLALGYTNNSIFNVMSGVSGLYESGETGGGIAFWAGGHRIDINNCTKNSDGTYSIGGKVVNPADFLVRHDGTGYAAGGKMWWGADGKIHADPQSFLINEEYVGNVMQLFKFEYSGGTEFTNIVHAIPQKPFESLSVGANGLTLYNGDKSAKFYIKDGVLFLEGDLAVTGGITMYASNGVTSGLLDQVYAILDSSKFEIKNGVITIKGDIGDGKVKGATLGGVAVTLNANGILEFDAYPTTLPASDVYAWAKAATKPTYSWDEITEKPSSFTPSAHTHDDRYYTESEIDTKLGLKLDTSLKGAADGLATLDSSGKVPSSQLPSYVDDVLEYANKAAFPSTGESGKIYIDKATNLTYRWGGTAYVEISQSLALGETSSTAYAGDKGKQNAEDIAELQTDKADKATTLSGYGITDAYTKTEVNTKLTDGSVTKIGTKDVGSATLPIYLKAGVPTAVGTSLAVDITGNSATATKLANARTLWGQSFDGSANVSGNMTGVGTITPTGEDLKVVGNLIVTGGIVMYADDGATIESGFAALLAAHIDGVTIKYNEAQQKIYSVMTGIKVNGTTYKPSETDGYITIPDYPTSLDWENIENKPSTFTPASHTHTFASLTSKPTTLSGYGITDAKIANGVITLGTVTITPLTAHQTVTLASGTNNGTLKLTVGSKTTDNIAVKGLGSAAYTNSSAYAAASHTHSYLPLAGGTMTGGITFSNSSHLQWNSGSYHQRIFLTDDSTADTAVFTFQQSTDSGTNWSNLMVIRDNGKVIANTFVGALSGNASTASKWATARKITLTGSVTGEVSIDGSGNVTLATTTNHTHSYVPLSGGTMSGNLILKGGTSSDMTYAGNVHPSIRFDNSDSSQNVSLIFTDYDSYRAPAGLKLVGNQGNEWFEAADIYATTFHGALSGNAATATTASKLGTANVGSGTQHFYLSGGTATASTSTVGGTAKPMYLKAGVMTAISDTVGGTAKPIFLNAGTLTAISATVGSASKPVYLSGGSITACSYDFTSYLPLAGGTMAAGARISHADGNMYIGRSDNNGWVMCQDMCSQSGSTYWKLMADGTFHSKVAVVSGNTSVGSLTINGINVTKSSDGILKIDGNLIVTGGITMYATDGVASGLMEQILVDNQTIKKTDKGVLYAVNTGNVRSIIMGSTTYTPNDSGAVTLPEKVTWANIEGKPSTFTPSSHTHSSITIPVCSSLNGNSDVFSVEYVGGNNSVATKPSGVDAFGVMRLRTAAGWYGQIMMSANTAPGIYYRNANGLSSSVGWKKLLDSGNFGDYAAAKSHTHAISQITNLQATLDGKAAASHTHSYLPLSGGTMTGTILAKTIQGVDTTNRLIYRHLDGQNCNGNYDLYLQYHQKSSIIYLNGETYKIYNKGANYNGNAATATALSSVIANDKLPERLREVTTSYGGRDANTIPSNGFYYCTSNINGLDDANVLQLAYANSSWRHQLMFKFSGTTGTGTGYDGKDLWTRLYNDNSKTWTEWYRILTSGNFNAYSPKLDGTGASGTWGISVTGNAATATKLTSSAGSATLPIYFSDGKPVACTASSVFSNLSNSGNNISVTVAGQNRTLTVGYASNADKLDGYHLSTLVDRSGENLIIGTTHASTIGWNQNGWSGGISTYDENNGVYKMWSTNGWHTLYYTLNSQYASKSISFSFDIMFVSSESTEGPVEVCVGASNSWFGGTNYKPSTSGSWEHKQGTFTLGSTPYFGIIIRGTDNSGKSCFYLIKNLKVELGDLPTIWTPAHADITWDNLTGKPSTFTPSAHTHNYLPLAGGTMTGALNFKNCTWNLMGDDAYIGDCNVAGMIGVKGANAATPGFVLYNNSGTLLGKLYASGNTLLWDGGTIQATTFSGNASTTSKWATARKITLTGSVTGSVSIDGSGDVTLATTTNHTHSYLPLAGGTMTGVITAKANMYEDAYNGALNMANSDIYGLNSIYTADLSDGQAEGIHFYRTSTTVDTFRISNGVMYFVPNRTLGSTATEYTVIHSGNYNSYAPSKTGTGASGTWGISITGNAATASKWATARTLTLTGSVTGSVSIDGSGNVSLATTTNHSHSQYLPLAGGTMTGTIKYGGANCEIIRTGGDDTSWRGGLKYSWSGNTTIALWGKNSSCQFVWHAGTDFSSNDVNGTATRTYDFQVGRANGILEALIGGNKIWHAGNDGSGSGLDADKLDGVHYLNILEREYTGSKYDSSAPTKTGWYRIAECYSYSKNGFLLYLGRNYHSSNNENYIFAITVSYGGNISINQIAGSANTRLITKIRVCWSNTSSNKAYVDFYVGTEAINGYFWYTVGSAKSYGTWGANPSTSGYNTVEFSTCNGMSSNKDFYISGQIGREGKNGNWISGRTNAMIRQTTANAYSAFASVKTYAGSWEIGEYTASGERLLFTYVTDTNVNNGNNNYSGQISFESGGNIIASGGITMYSDLRKKNILSNEVLSVKEIAAAPLFRHTYKSDDNQYIHVGTSAQYWSGIHEDWFTRKDSEGYYQMELQNLGVAMGISLAREIVKYESKTDKKIRLMRKRINELEKANESLEARVKELEERRTA